MAPDILLPSSPASKAYVSVPGGGGGTPVLLLHAWWGLNGFFREYADRLASDGFAVVAPDLYEGDVATTPDEAEARMQRLDREVAASRVQAALDTLLSEHAGGAKRAAVIGFSMGAMYGAELAAQRREVGVLVTYYGGLTELPAGPEGAPPPAYLGHWGEADTFDPIEPARDLAARIGEERPGSALHIYPGGQHWFAENDRTDVYDRESAELAYRRTVEFIREHLR
jgi:carboxymethylenebutenolidase